jgi:hypothetical protein
MEGLATGSHKLQVKMELPNKVGEMEGIIDFGINDGKKGFSIPLRGINIQVERAGDLTISYAIDGSAFQEIVHLPVVIGLRTERASQKQDGTSGTPPTPPKQS